MSAPWPDAMPAPDAASIRVSRPDVRTSLEMDNGAVRRLRRSLAAPYHVDGELWLTPEQKAAFDHFYRFELRDGLWWFTAPWLDGLGLTSMAARFREPPRLTRASAVLWKAAIRLEVIDAAQAVDTQDWPVSNVVTATGLPTDHMALWLKPDTFPWQVGHGFSQHTVIPSYHDPAVGVEVYSLNYGSSVKVGNLNGFPSLQLVTSYSVAGWNVYPASPWLRFPIEDPYDCSFSLVYGCDWTGSGLIFTRWADIRNSPNSPDWKSPGWNEDYYRAQYQRAVVDIGDGPSTNPNGSFPAAYLRVATFLTPFRHGACSAYLNGQSQVTNFPARKYVYSRGAGGSLIPDYLYFTTNGRGYGYSDSAHILELAVWRKALSATEVTAVHNFFIDKYAIPL